MMGAPFRPAEGPERRLPAALLLHALVLATLILARHPTPAPPPAGPVIEIVQQAPLAALPALGTPDIPAAGPIAQPEPERVPTQPPDLAAEPAPELLQARDPPAPRLVRQPPTRPAAPAPAALEGTAPAGSAAGATTGAAAQTLAAPDPAWNQLLTAWLDSHRSYPTLARRRGEQGEVLLRIDVDADGHVRDQAITQSSGAASLDRAALDLMRGATLPPPGVAASRVIRLLYVLRD